MIQDHHGSIHKRKPSRRPIPVAFRRKPYLDSLRPPPPVSLDEFFPASTTTEEEIEEEDEEEGASSRFSTPSPTPSEADLVLKDRFSSLRFPPTSPSKPPLLDRASSKFGARRQLLFDRFKRSKLPPSFQATPGIPTSTSDQSNLCSRLDRALMLEQQSHPQRYPSRSMDLPRSTAASSSGASSSASSASYRLAPLPPRHYSRPLGGEGGLGRQPRTLSRPRQEDPRRHFENGDELSALASQSGQPYSAAAAIAPWTSPTKNRSPQQSHKGRSNSEQISPSKEVRAKMASHAPGRHGGSASASSSSAHPLSMRSDLQMARFAAARLPAAFTLSSRGKRIEKKRDTGAGKTSLDDDTFKSHLHDVETSFDDLELTSLSGRTSSDSLVLDCFAPVDMLDHGLGAGFPAPPSTRPLQVAPKKQALREVRSTGNLRSAHQALRGRRQSQHDENDDLFGGRRGTGGDDSKVAMMLPTRSPLRERRAKPPLSLRPSHGNVLLPVSTGRKQGLKSPGGVHSPPPCPPPTTPLPDLPPTPAPESASTLSRWPPRKTSVSSVHLPERLRSASISKSREAPQYQPLIFRHDQTTAPSTDDDDDDGDDDGDDDDDVEVDGEDIAYGVEEFEEAYGSSSGGCDGHHTSAESSFSSPTSVSSPFTPLDGAALHRRRGSSGSKRRQAQKTSSISTPFSANANGSIVAALSKALDWDAAPLGTKNSFHSTVNSTGNALGLDGVPPPPVYYRGEEEEGQIVYGFAM